MNNEEIAELVHELVKNPKGLLPLENKALEELKTKELTLINRVFSGCETSGDILAIDTLPLGFWI
ncbi:hypothetical protein [Desulfitobacterium sp.]|uniref:hypothetical protein n=1 Tax=Desulfitobacterium sp. TaxID=49981 RepID=UPI002B21575A|nr:hypothetical protein [Desulfitobacterium sp.]MEA4902149.1 hypothetical protein [Desulfitobacterium sp.]